MLRLLFVHLQQTEFSATVYNQLIDETAIKTSMVPATSREQFMDMISAKYKQ